MKALNSHARFGMVLLTLVTCFAGLFAQELEPRAYLTLPVGANFFVATYSHSRGNVLFDPSLPFEDVSARINVVASGYMRAFDFFGRSASVAIALPYAWGDMNGLVDGQRQGITRSGLADVRFRFACNVYGGPALSPREFSGYSQKTNLGVSLVVAAPTGQYDPVKLINIGANRWAIKPEIGVSHALERWHFDLYLGAWFFGSNEKFLATSQRTQAPIGSIQGHISYTLKPRLWLAFDANYYTGGRTSVDRVRRADLQESSRLGLSLSVPVAKQQSIKFSASTGAFARVGADFNVVAVAYQFLWF